VMDKLNEAKASFSLVLCPSKFKERHASTSQFHLERL